VVAQTESWKPVVGYEGLYEVSSAGGVRRLRPANRGGIGPQFIQLNSCGYPSCKLTKGGVRRYTTVHKLVMAAFVGPRPDRREVNHKNGIRHDNRLENLEYVSHSENLRHAVRIGLYPVGDEHPCSKLRADQVADIRRRVAIGHLHRDIAADLGISKTTVGDICRGKSWRPRNEGGWRSRKAPTGSAVPQ
jgi:hypothetical protein